MKNVMSHSIPLSTYKNAGVRALIYIPYNQAYKTTLRYKVPRLIVPPLITYIEIGRAHV